MILSELNWKVFRKKGEIFCLVLIFSFFILISSVQATAGVPKILNYQGRLLDVSGNLLGGAGTDFCFKFSIYDDETFGAPDYKIWPTSGDPSIMTVSVKNGVFNVGIGATTTGGDLLDFNFQATDTIYLNVEVASKVGVTCQPGDGAEDFQNFTLRQRIVSAGYAINAGTVGGFTPSQSPTGNQIPVLTSGNLLFGGAVTIDSAGSGALNLGTGANAKTITIGNNTATTTLVFTRGASGDITFSGFNSCTALETDSSGNLVCGVDDAGGGGNTFLTFDAPAGTDPVADTATDTLQLLVSGNNFTITGSSTADSLTFDISESALAGAGLVVNGDALDIGAGFGIAVNADNIAIATSTNFTWGGTHTFNVTSTFLGDIIANDASADTILIGQSGATDDIVTIAGDISLTDDQWSVSGAGAASLLTVNGLTITTTTGTLTIGSGKTLTASSSLTFAGTDATIFTYPSASGTVVTTGASQALTNKTYNGLTITTTTGTLTIASGKTFTASNTLAFLGTDGTVFTFPTASGTVAALDVTQILTNKTISGLSNTLTNIATSSLATSSITVNSGIGLVGGGLVSLGGALTIDIGAGNGIATSADSISINLPTSGTSSATTSNSGLEVSSSGLAMLRGCSNTQILKWNSSTVKWECATAGGGNSFETMDAPSGTDPVADSATDILQLLVTGTNLTITGSSTADSLTFDIDESVLAGAGLVANGSALDIGAGNGVSVGTDSITINLTTTGTSSNASSNSGLEVSSSGLAMLRGCVDGQILKWSSGLWMCSVDAGATTSPFGAAGGIITKTTVSNRLSLQYGDAADVQFEIENTTAGTVPTADAIQINLSGGSGITTDGVDGLYINIEGADGTDNTVSALHLDFDPISGSAGDNFYALNIDSVTGTSANETAINIGLGWDSALMVSSTVIISGSGVLQSAGLSGTYSNALTLSSASNDITAGTLRVNSEAFTDLTGNGLLLSSGALTVDAVTTGTTTATSTNSGLEVALSGLRLLGGCSGGQVLKWNASSLVWECSDAGGEGTLQQAYDADTDGSDVTISLTTADDSLVFSNPSSGGTDSGYILHLNQQASGDVDNLRLTNDGTGSEIVFLSTTPQLEFTNAFNMTWTDASNTIAQIKEQWSSLEWGGLIRTGAFVGMQNYFRDDFQKERVQITGDTVGGSATGLGDSFYWGFDEQTVATADVVDDTVNGVFRLSTTAVNNAVLLFGGAAAANANLNYAAANLPIVEMKVRPSAVGANNDVWFGLADTAAASTSTLPNIGIYFTNNDGTIWTGMTDNGASVTTVACTDATISTTSFAYLRIEVRATNEVHFFIDPNTSDGINPTECGSGSSTNIPTSGLTLIVYHSVTTGGTAAHNTDVDYVIAWQDDAPDEVAAENTEPPLSIEETPLPRFDARVLLAEFLAQMDSNAATADIERLNTGRLAAAIEIITPTITASGLTIDNITSLNDAIIFNSDTIFIGRPYFNTDTAGFAVINQNTREVEVVFEKEYLEQPVVTVSIAQEIGDNQNLILNDNLNFIVAKKNTKGFTILLNKSAPTDIKFNWIALAVKNAKTFFSIKTQEIVPELFPENASPENVPAETPTVIIETPSTTTTESESVAPETEESSVIQPGETPATEANPELNSEPVPITEPTTEPAPPEIIPPKTNSNLITP